MGGLFDKEKKFLLHFQIISRDICDMGENTRKSQPEIIDFRVIPAILLRSLDPFLWDVCVQRATSHLSTRIILIIEGAGGGKASV